MFITGSGGLITFAGFISFFSVILQGILLAWNPISFILPGFATLLNVGLTLSRLVIQGLLGVFCLTQPSQPGFDAQTDCPVLWQWISFAPTVAEILKKLVEFLVFLVEIGAFTLFPGTCIRKCLDLSLFPFSCSIDLTCESMCTDLGLLPGCFNLLNALTWIFTDLRILEFLVNYWDFFFGIFILTPIIFFANQIFLWKIIYECPAFCFETVCLDPFGFPTCSTHDPPACTCYQNYQADFCISTDLCTQRATLFQIIELVIVSEGGVIGQFLLGIVFMYLIVVFDWIYCYTLSSANGKCLLNLFCNLILSLIGLGFLCPLQNCPCNQCASGWTILTDFGGPCTLQPGCECNPLYSIMVDFVMFILEIF